MLKLDQLSELIKEQEKLRKELLKDWNFNLDSANLQTKDKEDFRVYGDELKMAGLPVFKQVSHAGRKINVYKVDTDQKERFNNLNYIELSEPKPGKSLKKTEWEYVSYVIENYDAVITALSKTDKVNKVRQIEDDKFCYFSPSNNKIQFRNKSIGKTENYNRDTEQSEEIQIALSKEREAKMRLMADFENYRKSSEARIGQITQNASSRILKKIIEIVDDFERAIETSQDEGIKLIYAKLQNLLLEENIERISIKEGDKYDPNRMEALSIIPTENQEENNTVETVVQHGYLHTVSGNILRPARVIVRKQK